VQEGCIAAVVVGLSIGDERASKPRIVESQAR
jgi:hypothetical protein